MLAYIRERFKLERSIQGSKKIESAIQRASEELDQMNYYHTMRMQKEKQRRTDQGNGIEHQSEEKKARILICELSKINKRLLLVSSDPPLRGVAEVLAVLGSSCRIKSVRCYENHAEVEFDNIVDADSAAEKLK